MPASNLCTNGEQNFHLFVRPSLCFSSRQYTSTLLGSTCSWVRYGSNSNFVASMLIGDWRLPLLHSTHSGLTRPQKSGPTQN